MLYRDVASLLTQFLPYLRPPPSSLRLMTKDKAKIRLHCLRYKTLKQGKWGYIIFYLHYKILMFIYNPSIIN